MPPQKSECSEKQSRRSGKLHRQVYTVCSLTGPAQGFPTPEGVTAAGYDSSKSDREGGNMSDGVEVCCAVAIADPKTFPPCAFEARIIALTLRAKGIDPLEAQTFAVNRKTIVVGNRLVFGTAAVFLTVVPVFVVARASAGFGRAQGAAIFLTDPVFVIRFAVPVHWEAGIANEPAGWQFIRVPGIAFVQRDHCFAVIDVFYGVVDVLGVIPLVGDESTRIQRDDLIGLFKYGFNNSGIRSFSGSGHLIKRQTGDAVYKDVVFITPVEFTVFPAALI